MPVLSWLKRQTASRVPVWLWLLVFSAGLLPLLHGVLGVWFHWLGANPIEAVTRASGDWALRFLLLTLLLSSLRRRLGWGLSVRLRRMLGLYAFAYAAVHVLLYLWLDQFFDWAAIGEDIRERPFILAGLLAFLALLPLALTSTRTMMRRLGARWKSLHRLVYGAGLLAVLHFWWMKESKSDVSEPLWYAVLLGMLLLERLPVLYRQWSGRSRVRAASGPD